MSILIFFYGLAFILMGMVLMTIPQNKDFFGILKNLWVFALFGIIHGANSWINMFVLRSGVFSSGMLSSWVRIFLPVSFVFILVFAILNILQRHPRYRWLRFIPAVCFLPWLMASLLGKGPIVSGIMARYFICFPAMIFLLAEMVNRLFLYRKESPKLVVVSAWLFIFGGGMYALVSGIVVPQADFFPASTINYTNFILVFGFPVQIIRMICAILMTAALFGMTGVFYKEGLKVRLVGGVRRKVLVFTVLFSSIFLVASVLMFYFSGLFTLRKATFSHQHAIAQLMSSSVGEMIRSEVKELKNHVTSPSIWESAINEANSAYTPSIRKDLAKYFAAKDREWERLSSGDPAVDRYINSPLSARLRKFAETKGDINEILVTDKYGGVVSASRKTDDFYQADEDWWKRAFNAGKGSVFIGDMEFDRINENWSITISVPVYGKDSEVIGIYRVVYNTLRFSEVVSKFKIGSTGQAILLDNNGGIICRSGHNLVDVQAPPEWLVIKEKRLNNDPSLSAYVRHDSGRVFLASWATVPCQILSQQGLKWTACVEQDTREIFESQEFMLLLYSSVLFLILAILSLYFSFLFVRLLIQPIEKMRLGMQEVAVGNLGYHLSLKSGDELEDLSDSFNLMTDTLRKTLVSKDALIAEVCERKQAEGMLEQTKDKLEKQAQELNIQLKETEKTHDIMMSMLEDNNNIREALEKSFSELKQAQEMMVQVAKLSAVGQLASGVAHEVKNPLGIILQGINYLENKIPVAEKDTWEVLQMMKDGIGRADRIINGLLDFSKSNKLDFREEDVNSVLESSINLAQLSSRFSGVQIVREMSANLPKVAIDKNKMEQVFINVLVNAAQAIDTRGSITVRTYLRRLEKAEKSRINKDVDYFAAGEEVLKVEFEDTGEGISEENLKKIFDAFFSTKGPKGGAGLGMGICLSIVDMHKGLIDVESRPGKGTKVTITLKLATEGRNG